MKIQITLDVEMDGDNLTVKDYCECIEECCADQNLYIKIDSRKTRVLED